MSGSATIPPCGTPSLMLEFKHGCEKISNGRPCACLPSANTCSTTLTLPVHTNTLTELTESFLTAIVSTKKYGFGLG